MPEDDAIIQNAIAALSSVNPYERFAAIETLARHQHTASLDRLVAATADPHLSVREAAVWALGDLGAPAAASPLCDIATDDDQPDALRLAALYGLGVLADPDTAPTLFRLHRNADLTPDLREAAARALIRYGDAAVEPLLTIYHEQPRDKDQRVAVLALLGQVGSPKAVHPLIDAARLGPSHARWAAVRSLGEIGDPTPVDMLIGLLSIAPELARIVLWALETIGETRGLEAAERWRHAHGYPRDDSADLPPTPPSLR